MRGHNASVLGLNSSSKSTIINALLGENRAATGVGETTHKVTSYENPRYTFSVKETFNTIDLCFQYN